MPTASPHHARLLHGMRRINIKGHGTSMQTTVNTQHSMWHIMFLNYIHDLQLKAAANNSSGLLCQPSGSNHNNALITGLMSRRGSSAQCSVCATDRVSCMMQKFCMELFVTA